MHGLSSANFVDTCLVFAMSPPYLTMSALVFATFAPTFAPVAASRQAGKQASRALTGSLCAALLRWHALRCQDGNHMPLDMPVSWVRSLGLTGLCQLDGCFHALRRLDSILSVALGCRSTHSYCPSHANERLMGWRHKGCRCCCSCC